MLTKPEYARAKAGIDENEDRELIQHSVKRVKKKINDYILLHYNELFFNSTLPAPDDNMDGQFSP